jgi:hypothetical protein
MEIRDAVEDREHRYTDDGEEIICLNCGIAWLHEEEGDFTFNSCEHLRFILHFDSDMDFDFFNEWDTDGFMRSIEKAHETDDEAHVLDILGDIKHPDIDDAFIYIWCEDPLYHPWIIWGYRKEA